MWNIGHVPLVAARKCGRRNRRRDRKQKSRKASGRKQRCSGPALLPIVNRSRLTWNVISTATFVAPVHSRLRILADELPVGDVDGDVSNPVPRPGLSGQPLRPKSETV